MPLLVSVDPGKHVAWWAAWSQSGRLEKCGRLKIKSAHQVAQWFGHHYPQLVLAIEKPMIVRRKPRIGQDPYSKGSRFDQARPSDIIDLAVAVGWVEAAPWVEVVEYLPNQWKGNLSKTISNNRTTGALSHTEREVVARAKIPQSLLHNCYDSIGIGLHHLKSKGLR